MAEEGKKISFGFSKTVKKPLVKNVAPVEEKKLDYIECVDDKAIKIIGYVIKSQSFVWQTLALSIHNLLFLDSFGFVIHTFLFDLPN